MSDDRFITMQCPSCNRAHPNTWANLEAHWEASFTCDGCGIAMWIDREEALAALDRAGDEGEITVMMVS